MLKIDQGYADYFDANDPGYPGGKTIDTSSPEAEDGTPIKAGLINNIYGFLQALIVEAFDEFRATGCPDEVGQSELLDALLEIVSKRINAHTHNGDAPQIEAGGIASGAVTEAKIGDAAVTSMKIANDAVTNEKIADGALSPAKLADIAADTESAKALFSSTTTFPVFLQSVQRGITHLNNGITYLNDRRIRHADQVEDAGRNLLDVLGVGTIPDAMETLRQRCASADFSDIEIGDYIDGLSLNGIHTLPPDGTAPQAWNNTYKNNRIVVAGFNTFGSANNARNYVVFVFRNIICTSKINFANNNMSGYNASDLKVWMGTAYNISGDYNFGVFASKLNAALGGGYLHKVSRICSNKEGETGLHASVFLPTEIEMFGYQTFGDELSRSGANVQIPLYAKSAVYRKKKFNGVPISCWLQTPRQSNSTEFCAVGDDASIVTAAADAVYGISPVFCIA